MPGIRRYVGAVKDAAISYREAKERVGQRALIPPLLRVEMHSYVMDDIKDGWPEWPSQNLLINPQMLRDLLLSLAGTGGAGTPRTLSLLAREVSGHATSTNPA